MAIYVSEDLLRESSSCKQHQQREQHQGHVVVCHRGTWSPRDLIDDVYLLWGTFRSSPRYVDARARKQVLLDLWPGARYTHIGHSLGGTVAMALVQRLGDSVDAEAHAFNPGVSFEGFAGPRSTIHLIAKDPVTFFTAAHPGSDYRIYPAHRHIHYMPLWAHQHSVYNFVAPPPAVEEENEAHKHELVN
jgi:pimeloyl-ACP methyl ester carboxylesterase